MKRLFFAIGSAAALFAAGGGSALADTAVWTGANTYNLTDSNSWGPTKPGADVAAQVASGTPHLNVGDVFKFAQRFEIGSGKSKTATVSMSGGTIAGNAEGGAVVVGTSGGTGALDVESGSVTVYDYIDAGGITNSVTVGESSGTGTLTVRGGTVQAAGVSVGEGGTGTLTVESGSFTADGTFAVGYRGTVSVTGGTLAGKSFCIGSTNNVAGVQAKMTVSGGKVTAADRFVCGGCRGAKVDVEGGTLAAPEICVGENMTSADTDKAAFALSGGRVETAGFTTGTVGTRTVTLGDGEIAATAANDDFFKGIDAVTLTGETVFENENDVTILSTMTGSGDLVKTGAGKLKLAGYAALAGKITVEEGVLDMGGSMIMGELEVFDGASVVNAKYDDVDALQFDSTKWSSGTTSSSPYLRISFTMSEGATYTATAKGEDGETKGAVRRTTAGLEGYSALEGWVKLLRSNGSEVGTAKCDVRMTFDFTGSRHYVIYEAYYLDLSRERLVSADGASAFPVTGAANVKTFDGVTMNSGKQMTVTANSALYWIGPDGGDWNDGNNWSATEGGAAAGTCPTSERTAFIGKSGTVRLAAGCAASFVVANASVVFTGASLNVGAGICGSGRVTFEGAEVSGSGTAPSVDVPLEIVGTSNALGGGLSLKGALRGDGTASALVCFMGDTGAFAGTLNLLDGSTFGLANTTYAFGALNGTIAGGSVANVYLAVGARDEDCALAGGWTTLSGSAINWEASTATLSCSVTNLAALRISGGGTVSISSAAALPSAVSFIGNGGTLVLAPDVEADVSKLITGSSAAVGFDDGGADRRWSVAFAASNVGGFIKRGAGTLTWSAKPTTGTDVTVEAGTLVVPFGTQLGSVTVSPGARIVVDLTGATKNSTAFSVTRANVGYGEYLSFTNAPSGYEYRIITGEDDGLVAMNGSLDYVWTGLGDDANWATLANWSVDGAVPSRVPASVDTVTFPYASSVAAPCISAAASVRSVDGVGDLGLTGSYGLSVQTRLALDGKLTLSPNAMSATSTDPDYYSKGNRLGVTVSSRLVVETVEGEGTVTASGQDLPLVVKKDEMKSFVGNLTAGRLVKRGEGTFNFIGEGVFANGVAVEAGTLRLGNYRDIGGIRMDFDAADAETNALGQVASWASKVGNYSFVYSAGDANCEYAKLTKSYFGGRTALQFRPNGKNYSRYLLSPNNYDSKCASRSLFVIYRPTGVDNGYIYADTGSDNYGLQLSSKYWTCPVSGYAKNGIFMGATYGQTSVLSTSTSYLTFWSDTPLRQTSGISEYLGTSGTANGFRGVIGEVVSYTRTLTHPEREVITKQLMRKWGIGYTDGGAITKTMPVTMKAGATLDLGGQTLTAKSFTGAGTVTDGVLQTADATVTQKGGALKIPAVDGTTYYASCANEKLEITDAEEAHVTIVVPKEWFVAGATGRRAIFCNSKDIHWKVGRSGVVPEDEGDGWWTLPGAGLAVRLR